MKLRNKVAIITGATSGIGKATAQLFANEGAKVVVVGRDESKGRDVCEAIIKDGGQAIFVKTDVSKSSEVKRMVDETIRKFGQIDILFNNAGISPVGTTVDTPEEVWDSVMDINLKSMFLCSKYVIPHMLSRGGGAIINTGSINCFMAWENEVAYDASKGGVLMFTKATAMDFAKNNIRVNCICPGAIRTPLLQKFFDESSNPKGLEQMMKKKHPLNRLGLPEEIARVALFLASDDSSFMTGAAVAVDGGILAGWV
jgi:NAD(P)-dependent dehydrogenase (short-subunit alcohol dehydrogenase family)